MSALEMLDLNNVIQTSILIIFCKTGIQQIFIDRLPFAWYHAYD